jgi:hypothetical protein
MAGEVTDISFGANSVVDADSRNLTLSFIAPESGYLEVSLNRDVSIDGLLVSGVTQTSDRGAPGFVTGGEAGPSGNPALRSGEVALAYPAIDNNGQARQMLSGWFVPEYTGEYSFDLNANDRASLWFETSGNGSTSGPTFRQLILDTETGGSSRSEKLRLVAGKRYWFEVRHYEQRNITREGFLFVAPEFDSNSFARLGYLLDANPVVQPMMADQVIPALLPDQLTAVVSVPKLGVTAAGGSNAWADRANSPQGAGAAQAIDARADTRYISYHKSHAGLVLSYPEPVAPAAIRFTAASDRPERDPVNYVLYGASDSAAWASGEWVKISEGSTFGSAVPARGASNTVPVPASSEFRHFKLVFANVRDEAKADALQIAEVALLDQASVLLGATPLVRSTSVAGPDTLTISLSATPNTTARFTLQSAGGITLGGTESAPTITGEREILTAYLSGRGNVVHEGTGSSVTMTTRSAQSEHVLETRTVSTVHELKDRPRGVLSARAVDGVSVDTLSSAGALLLRASPQALQAYLGHTGQVFYDGSAQSLSVRVSGQQSGRITVSRDFEIARLAVDASEDEVVLNGTAEQIAEFLAKPGNLGFEAVDVYRLELQGEFVAGSVIRLGGVAATEVLYTVRPEDLTVNGDGTGGEANASQRLTQIAVRLAQAIRTAEGLKASVQQSGAVLRFESLPASSAGALTVRANATGGTVVLTKPDNSILMRVSDGTSVREQSIVLDVAKPTSISAVFNGSGLEIIDPNGSSMRLSRFALDDLQLGSKDDTFTVTRFGAAPIVLSATEGRDKVVVNLGNTVSADGATRLLTLRDQVVSGGSLLADDELSLVLKKLPLKSNGEGTLLQLGKLAVGRNDVPDVIRMVSGVEEVRWDSTLGKLVIRGDVIRLAGFEDAQGTRQAMDLGSIQLEVIAQRLSIESDLIVGQLKLDVSERITLDGKLLRYGGSPTELAPANATAAPAAQAMPAISSTSGSPVSAMSSGANDAAKARDGNAGTAHVAPMPRALVMNPQQSLPLFEGLADTAQLKVAITVDRTRLVTAQPAAGITVGGATRSGLLNLLTSSATAEVSVTGTVSALRDYLARTDALSYVGTAGSITLRASGAGIAERSLALSPAALAPTVDLGNLNPGFKFTLASAGVAKSVTLTTASDDPRRDPSQYSLYGANSDLDWNAAGWMPITENRPTRLPVERGAQVESTFANTTAYRYYKLVFTGVRHLAAGQMAIAEARVSVPQVPTDAGADMAIDMRPGTRWMAVGESGNGLTVELPTAEVANNLVLTSAADQPGRDPVRVSIYGAPSNLPWGDAGWAPLGQGLSTGLSLDRGSSSAVSFANETAWRYYKIVFDATRDPNLATVQIAELGLRRAPLPTEWPVAAVVPVDRAPQIVAAQSLSGPLDAAALAALAAQNAGQGLQLKPADPTATISIGAGGSLDPSGVSSVPMLVVGATGGSNPVSLGGSGSSLTMSTPLVIQAQGSGGKVRIGGKIKGTSTEVQGSGNTTEIDGRAEPAELEMTEGLYINDALRIFGTVTLTAGDSARKYDARPEAQSGIESGVPEYRLALSGNFSVGDQVIVSGAAFASDGLTGVDIVYQVSAADLEGSAGGGVAGDAVVLGRIASGLRAAAASVLAQPGIVKRAEVGGSGSMLRFIGLQAGDEGAFAITAVVRPVTSSGVVTIGAPDLTVTGRINGSSADNDSLTLRAFGGDVTVEGRVGAGIGDDGQAGDFSFAGGAGYSTESGRAAVLVGIDDDLGRYTLRLTGALLAGDRITVRGAAAADIVYTVTVKDLSGDGTGGGGSASDEQARANVIARLAELVSEQATGSAPDARLASVSLAGESLTLAASDGRLIDDFGVSVGRMYASVPLLGGSGSGASAHLVVTDGVVTSVAIESLGGGYREGDVLSVSRAALGDTSGSGEGFSLTVHRIYQIETLKVSEAVDVDFRDQVHVDGNLVIYARGVVTFADEVVIYGTGSLDIQGATEVVFNRGIRLAGGAAAHATPITIAPRAGDDRVCVRPDGRRQQQLCGLRCRHLLDRQGVRPDARPTHGGRTRHLRGHRQRSDADGRRRSPRGFAERPVDRAVRRVGPGAWRPGHGRDPDAECRGVGSSDRRSGPARFR